MEKPKYWEMTPEETGIGDDYTKSPLGQDEFFEVARIIKDNIWRMPDQILTGYADRGIPWALRELRKRKEVAEAEQRITQSRRYGADNLEPWEKTLGQFYDEYKHPLEGFSDFKLNNKTIAKLKRMNIKDQDYVHLSDLIEEPDLFATYPQLSNVYVTLDNAGMAHTAGNRLSFGKDMLERERIAHEVTHFLRSQLRHKSAFRIGFPETKINRKTDGMNLVQYRETPSEKEARASSKILSGGYLRHVLVADMHRTLVERALSEGKNVPHEVLAEYPDLHNPSRAPVGG